MHRHLLAAGTACTLLIVGGIGPVLPGPDAEPETPGSRLQGSASLGRNRRVVGATVLVSPSGESSRLFVTSSDVKGNWRFENLPNGDYRVELRREGLAPVVKENVGVRFPSRAVVEVTMRPIEGPLPPAASSRGAGASEANSHVAIAGEIVDRAGKPIPEVPLRFVRSDGLADPVVVRSALDGSFSLPSVPAGAWRLRASVVGFLPIWASMEIYEDTRLSVAMVSQPAGYTPSPLELMPPEQPIPPPHELMPPPAAE